MKVQSCSWYSGSEVWYEAREWGKMRKRWSGVSQLPYSPSPFCFSFSLMLAPSPQSEWLEQGLKIYTRETSHMLLYISNVKIYVAYFRHYPTTKFTAVADTPENKRLAANTKKQSNVSPFLILSNLLLFLHYRPESSQFSFAHWAGESIISKWLKFLLTFL